MSYFCDENELQGHKKQPFRFILKRPPAKQLERLSDSDDETLTKAPVHLFRHAKRIRRNQNSDISPRSDFSDKAMLTSKEFNEQYRAKYLTELQKYKETLNKFN